MTIQFNQSNIIIGIAGGTGSGKTTLAHAFRDTFGDSKSVIIDTDSYYKGLSHLPTIERSEKNFDHPDALDFELLIEHLKMLKNGQAIQKPTYCFKTHTRRPDIAKVCPRDIVIIEGILLFAVPLLREILDVKVFVDVDADIRFIRRLKRDVVERGRTVESVIEQYLSTVRPMHQQFVEPGKQYADVIVRGDDEIAKVVNDVVQYVSKWFPTVHITFEPSI